MGGLAVNLRVVSVFFCRHQCLSICEGKMRTVSSIAIASFISACAVQPTPVVNPSNRPAAFDFEVLSFERNYNLNIPTEVFVGESIV
jgi:hypothetical protein